MSEQEVDWDLDMDRLFAHMDYRRENPPAGTMIKQLAEAYFGTGDKDSDSSSTDDNSKMSSSLEDFVADFTGMGGSVR